MRKNRPSSRSLFLALSAVTAVLWGCNREPQARVPQQGAPVAVEVATAAQLPVQRSVEVTGTLFGDEEITLSAKVPGRIQRTFAEMGDKVAPGVVLGQIEPTDYELAVQQAEAALAQTLSRLGLSALPKDGFDPTTVPTVKQARLQAANARARFERAERLFKQQPPLISEQDYADAQTAAAVADSAADVALLAANTTLAEVKSRQLDLAVKQQLLSDTKLRTPSAATKGISVGSGTNSAPAATQPKAYQVTARLISAGDYVREGTPAYRLVVDNPIRFRASVPERYLAEVATGQKVAIAIEGRENTFDGTLKRINPQVDSSSRSFQVEIIADNKDGLLRPGAFARGEIATRLDEKALFVPAAAVNTFAGIRKVYSVKAGKVAEHEVTLGITRDKMIEITSGLEPGVQVIVAGPSRMAGGLAVEIKQRPATAPRQ